MPHRPSGLKRTERQAWTGEWPLALALGLFFLFYGAACRKVCVFVRDYQFAFVAKIFVDGLRKALAHPSLAAWRALPGLLLRDEYNCPGEVYFSIPFVWLFGGTPAFFFWRNAAAACWAIVAVRLVARRLLKDHAAAALPALLLAVNPTFVLLARIGLISGLLLLPLCLTGLLLLLRFSEEDLPRYGWGAGALFGAAFATRIYMASFLAALAASWPRFGLPNKTDAPGRRATTALGCIAFFLACSAPWIIGLALDWQHWQTLWGEQWPNMRGGRSNLNYPANLLFRLGQVKDFLEGRVFLERFFAVPASARPMNAWPALLAMLGGVIMVGWAKTIEAGRRQKLAWLVLFSALYLAFSPFSVSRLNPLQIFPLLPLACILACVPIEGLAGRRKGLISSSLAAAGLFGLIQTAQSARFFIALDRAQMQQRAPEVAQMVLRDFPDSDLVDLGCLRAHEMLDFLAPGPSRVYFIDNFDGPHDRLYYRQLRDLAGLIGRRPAVYLVDESDELQGYINFVLRSQAGKMGFSPQLAKRYPQPTGAPGCAAYRLEKTPGAATAHEN